MNNRKQYLHRFWHCMNCLILAFVMAWVAVPAYPLLMIALTPLDHVTLPKLLLGLHLSSVCTGAIAYALVTSIPAIARKLTPDLSGIISHQKSKASIV
ncbi:hypothetical protein [Undibacterium oligocarboniphilum]|uniref:Uncharacterized protein n=1 Tax=Undibacterium oligocarboniphilum TaxID=666702 RepID=A0A850QI30_9BURK|nr:hypothetical protein [Undibacterium oligocarboniphilum]MBC3871476.1 hypothetical protein [Undibacterium oligocarboniphilum]NVO78948.1 hypothetical protein [Undibacterium oligocarboniphilum]